MSKFNLDSETLLQRVGNEAVLLDLKKGIYFQLNETGRCIVDGLVEGRSLAQIVDLLCEEYSVDAEVARLHINSLIRDMENHELIEKV
jgi:hypothetical protein